MTDPEIVRYLVEKVCGWHVQTEEAARKECLGPTDCRIAKNGQIFRPGGWWNPLTDARATEQVMEALRGKGFRYWIHARQLVAVEISRCGEKMVRKTADDWKRAFCLAAVEATGGEA